MQVSKFLQAFFYLIASLLFATQVQAAALEQRADQFVCDVNNSAGKCNTNDAGVCLRALKAQFSKQPDGRLKFTANYGAYHGGCRCYAQCRTGINYPSCYVTSQRVDQIMYGLRDACISSAAHALGYVYADNAKWEFAKYP